MAAPRWEVGSVVGDLTVLHVLGTEHAHGRIDWVYRWQCKCGNIERIPQRNMEKGRIDCLTCARLRNRAAAAQSGAPRVLLPSNLPREIPNFLTLPVPATIKTGPERWHRLLYRLL